MASSQSSRRTSLALSCALLGTVLTPSSRAQQRIGVDVEATPYGGITSGQLPSRGGCAFAPTVGTTFGGVGMRARVHQHQGDRTRGLSISTQAAVERQSHTLRAEGSDMQRAIPDDQTMAAGAVSVGYDWRYFGVHAGGIVREQIGEPSIPCDITMTDSGCLSRATYPHTVFGFFPDLRLRGGPSDGLHGEVGVGAYTPAMLLRPGAHLGVGYTTRRGHDLAARCGVQSIVGDSTALRCDVSGTLPLNEWVSLSAGGALVDRDERLNFDARASVTVRLGP